MAKQVECPKIRSFWKADPNAKIWIFQVQWTWNPWYEAELPIWGKPDKTLIFWSFGSGLGILKSILICIFQNLVECYSALSHFDFTRKIAKRSCAQTDIGGNGTNWDEKHFAHVGFFSWNQLVTKRSTSISRDLFLIFFAGLVECYGQHWVHRWYCGQSCFGQYSPRPLHIARAQGCGLGLALCRGWGYPSGQRIFTIW